MTSAGKRLLVKNRLHVSNRPYLHYKWCNGPSPAGESGLFSSWFECYPKERSEAEGAVSVEWKTTGLEQVIVQCFGLPTIHPEWSRPQHMLHRTTVERTLATRSHLTLSPLG